jgi:hypothetical protein
MESRINYIEKKLDEQATRYANSQAESVERATRMEGNLDKLLIKVEGINSMLSEVLKTQHDNEIKQAAELNKIPASKWNSLSSGTKNIICGVIIAAVTILVGYLFAKFGIK